MKLVIADVSIRSDADGRYCLNDLHRASGGDPNHRPNQFLRLDHVQSLISHLETAQICAVKTKEGRGGATFVAKQLVYAYAMWISAEFHIRVIDAYDALVTGSLDEAIRIARRQADRQAARLEAPALTDAVIHSRKVAGKEVEHYHFVNEFDLINRVALGMSAKQYRAAHGLSADESIRDTLTALEIKCIGHLQRYNASLIDFGLPFEKRKTELHKLYCLQYAGALACEVQRLEA